MHTSYAHNLSSELTELHLCNDWIRVQRSAITKLVDGRDTELILIALDQFSDVEGAGFTLASHHCPGDPGGLSLLYYVVSDGRAAIVLWRVPPNCTLLCSDACETDGTLRKPRGV